MLLPRSPIPHRGVNNESVSLRPGNAPRFHADIFCILMRRCAPFYKSATLYFQLHSCILRIIFEIEKPILLSIRGVDFICSPHKLASFLWKVCLEMQVCVFATSRYGISDYAIWKVSIPHRAVNIESVGLPPGIAPRFHADIFCTLFVPFQMLSMTAERNAWILNHW